MTEPEEFDATELLDAGLTENQLKNKRLLGLLRTVLAERGLPLRTGGTVAGEWRLELAADEAKRRLRQPKAE